MTTMFSIDRRPRVDIAAELSRQRFRENHLPTTLGLEFGHLLLHLALWREQCIAENGKAGCRMRKPAGGDD